MKNTNSRKKEKEKILNLALEYYRNKEITAWKAARIANIPLSQFMDIMAARKIDFHYGMKEFKEDTEDLD